MSLTRWLGVAVIVAGVSEPAMADILVWRDRAGISHYTNDIANVPPEYRAEAMTVAKDWARAQPPPEPVPVPAAVVTTDPAAATAHEGAPVAPAPRAPFVQAPAAPAPVTER